MKKFGLLRCVNGANFVISECMASTKQVAVGTLRYLNPNPVNTTFTNFKDYFPLDKDGYAKDGEVTYCIGEFFGS